MAEKETHLIFKAEVIEGKVQVKITNKDAEHLGRIEKVRLGRWMSWCLFLEKDCYMSAGCLDEVREKIRKLNNNKRLVTI